MLDFFQIKQHRIVFSVLAGLAGIIMILMIISGISSFSGEGRTSSDNLIYFSGQGKVYTKPDIVFVDFSVVTQGANIDSVQEANTQKMNNVIEFLKGFGIEEKDIKTTNYNLYPQYNYENNRIPQIIGYQINQTLSVKIREIDKAGEILKKVVNTGINQVNSFRFGVEDDEVIKEEARKIAIEDAKQKAEALASEIGIRLGKVVGFSENSNDIVPMYDSYKAYGMGGASGTPNVEAGENEIIVNVTLTYEIK
jgi:hypothetical protein